MYIVFLLLAGLCVTATLTQAGTLSMLNAAPAAGGIGSSAGSIAGENAMANTRQKRDLVTMAAYLNTNYQCTYLLIVKFNLLTLLNDPNQPYTIFVLSNLLCGKLTSYLNGLSSADDATTFFNSYIIPGSKTINQLAAAIQTSQAITDNSDNPWDGHYYPSEPLGTGNLVTQCGKVITPDQQVTNGYVNEINSFCINSPESIGTYLNGVVTSVQESVAEILEEPLVGNAFALILGQVLAASFLTNENTVITNLVTIASTLGEQLPLAAVNVLGVTGALNSVTLNQPYGYQRLLLMNGTTVTCVNLLQLLVTVTAADVVTVGTLTLVAPTIPETRYSNGMLQQST